jgi:D-alanyl-D-alanine carboxypeptidase
MARMRRLAAALLLIPVLRTQTPPANPAPATAANCGPVESALRDHLRAWLQVHRLAGGCAAAALADGTDAAVALGTDASGKALTTDGKLMSGSIGKTYCAAVALQLVHEGKLALDGRVQDVLGRHEWFAKVPNAASMTLRQLLNHTSGVPEHVWKQPFQEAVAKAGDRALTPAECIGYVLGDDPVAPAGERWSYADTNYLLVGLCIEQVTGRRYDDELRARLLAPLHLDATIPNDRRDLPGLVCGQASGIGFHTGPVVADGRYFTNPAFEYCGGGISSTTRDLARWCRALFSGDVIPAELRPAHRDGVPARRGITDRYGLGCFVTQTAHGEAFGHSGVMPGYLSCMFWYPALQLAAAAQFPTDDHRQVGNLQRLVDELAGAADEARKAVPARR